MDNIYYLDRLLSKSKSTFKLFNSKDYKLIGSGFTEDITLSVTNNWGEGGTYFGLEKVVDIINKAKQSPSLTGGLNAVAPALGFLKSMGVQDTDVIRDITNSVSKYTNSHYITGKDFYKTYGGSTVSVPTQVKITYITDSYDVDIYRQLQTLLNVSIGDFKSIGGVAGVMTPPNDFQVDIKTLSSKTVKGSLILSLGGIVSIKNLVVSALEITYSKTKVKKINRPLYIDCSVTLEPAKLLSHSDIKNLHV